MNGGNLLLGNHLVKFSRFTERVNGLNKLKTKCEISNRAGDVLAEGTVSLHHKDTNIKIVGRHNAYKRAMSNLTASKEEKTNIWSDYREKLRTPLD